MKQTLGKIIITAWFFGLFGYFIATAADRTRYVISILPFLIIISYTIYKLPNK
jgi:hypothetical protein